MTVTYFSVDTRVGASTPADRGAGRPALPPGSRRSIESKKGCCRFLIGLPPDKLNSVERVEALADVPFDGRGWRPTTRPRPIDDLFRADDTSMFNVRFAMFDVRFV